MHRITSLLIPLLFLPGLLFAPAPTMADESGDADLQGRALLKQGQAHEADGMKLYQDKEFTAAAAAFTEAAVDGIHAMRMLKYADDCNVCVRLVIDNLGHAQQCRKEAGTQVKRDVDVDAIKLKIDSGMFHFRNRSMRAAMDSFVEGCTLAARAMYDAASDEDRSYAYTLFKHGFRMMMEILGLDM